MVIRIHYNKFGAPRLPWTIKTSRGCFPCSRFEIQGTVRSEEKPEKKTNPRYFLKVEGELSWDGDVCYITGR